MKILAGGDFHGNPKAAERLAKKATDENVDLILLCGDITHSDTIRGPMISPFLETGKKVLFVPGNHDSPATSQFITDFYEIINLENKAFYTYDIGIFGSGAINCGIHQNSDSDVLKHLSKGFEDVKGLKKKIMVTHTHPSDTRIAKMSNFIFGSDAVRKAIDQFKPDLHICCHVHEAEGVEEKVGDTIVHSVGPKGKVFDL